MWGSIPEYSYWHALATEPWSVSAEERRAVGLMRTMFDDERVSAYLYSGDFYALGNITKRTYKIQHGHGLHGASVTVLDDGGKGANYCIGFGLEKVLTDSVIAVVCMIEGEEAQFLATANKSPRSEDVGFIAHHTTHDELGRAHDSPHETSLKSARVDDLHAEVHDDHRVFGILFNTPNEGWDSPLPSHHATAWLHETRDLDMLIARKKEQLLARNATGDFLMGYEGRVCRAPQMGEYYGIGNYPVNYAQAQLQMNQDHKNNVPGFRSLTSEDARAEFRLRRLIMRLDTQEEEEGWKKVLEEVAIG